MVAYQSYYFGYIFLEDTKAKKKNQNKNQPQNPNPPYIALYGVKDECHTGIWIPKQNFYACKMQT